MTPQDFLHLPCDILGDAYDNLIANAINEAENLAPDSVGDQKNIVSYRYWEAVVNLVMSEGAKRDLGYESIEFSAEQISFFQDKQNKFERLAGAYIAELTNSSYFKSVY